jgi:hypothetical protein
MWEPQPHAILRASTACTGITLPILPTKVGRVGTLFPLSDVGCHSDRVSNISSLLSLFWKNTSRLMRSLCYLWICTPASFLGNNSVNTFPGNGYTYNNRRSVGCVYSDYVIKGKQAITSSQNLSYFMISSNSWPPLWSNGQSSWLQIQRSRVRFPALPDFLRSIGSGTGSTQPHKDNWGATWIEK